MIEEYLKSLSETASSFAEFISFHDFETCETIYYELEDINIVDAFRFAVSILLIRFDFPCRKYAGGFLEHMECVAAQSGDSTILFILLEAKLHPIYEKNADVKFLIDDWTECSKSFMERNGYKGFKVTDELMKSYERNVLERYKSGIRLLGV